MVKKICLSTSTTISFCFLLAPWCFAVLISLSSEWDLNVNTQEVKNDCFLIIISTRQNNVQKGGKT